MPTPPRSIELSKVKEHDNIVRYDATEPYTSKTLVRSVYLNKNFVEKGQPMPDAIEVTIRAKESA